MENKKPWLKYVKFAVIAVLYTLWVIWLRDYWLLLGLLLIIDIYFTKKIKWSNWKKSVSRYRALEWADALVFGLVAATFIRLFVFELYAIPTSSLEKTLLIGDHLVVSKVSYGPKMPNTPLALPLVHNTMPFTASANSYVEWLKWPYKRLSGLGHVQRNDIVVFNFPAGDTIVVGRENPDYYSQVSQLGRANIWANNIIKARPVDKRENFVKRCVAIPGDTLRIVDGQVFINSKPQKAFPGVQYNYLITTSYPFNERMLQKRQISKADQRNAYNNRYLLPLTRENYEYFRQLPNVVSIERVISTAQEVQDVFPRNSGYAWTKDNMGPLLIPAKGVTVSLTTSNLPLYQRIISVYESNKLEVRNNVIYINGQPQNSYTFKMDYYWMMGDNRDNSADSRYWGFVPEDHVVGKPVMVIFSLDEDRSFLAKIRWNRLFRLVKNEDSM